MEDNYIIAPVVHEDGVDKVYEPIVKITDTLPTGTEVDYNGDTVPTGWEEIGDTVQATIGTTNPNNDRVWFKQSKNLFDFTKVEAGYLSGAGNVISNNYYSSSNYIYIKGFSKITISGNSGNNENICFYNNDKTFISYETTGSNTSMTLNVPNNAYYVRATAKNTNLNQYQIEEGSTATAYEPYKQSINVDNEEIYSRPVILYNNTSGTSLNVTLSDSVSNYDYVEIFYKDDQNYASSIKIKGSDTGFILQYNKVGINQDRIYLYDTRYTINNNTLTPGISLTLLLQTSGISVNGTDNLIYITKVVGYK